jgi:ribonuclease E
MGCTYMAKRMLIDATHPEETRVVVVSGNKLEELDFEIASKKQLKGNIYLAKVTRVEPSLQAAFVEYGGNRHGFLAFSEIHPDYYRIPVADREALLAQERELAEREEAERDEANERRFSRERHARDFDISADVGRDNAADDVTSGGFDPSPSTDADDGGADEDNNDRDNDDPGPTTYRAAGYQPEQRSEPYAPGPDGDTPGGETPAPDTAVNTAAKPVVDAPVEADQPQEATIDPGPAPAAELGAGSLEPAVPEPGFPESGVIESNVSAPADVTGENAVPPPAETEAPAMEAAVGAAAAEISPVVEVSGDVSGEAPVEIPAEIPVEIYVPTEASAPVEISSPIKMYTPIAETARITTGESAESAPTSFDDLGDETEEVQRRRVRPLRSYKIQEVIKRRQILLVQVVKEERGNKGAALTTYLSLPGRYCVLMPNTGRGGGISRKITNPQDRKRLKEMMADLDIPEGMAVILRTAGMERSKAEIKRDLEYLLRLWDSIRDLTLQSTAPTLIYEEANLIKRSVRDLYANDLDEVLVEGEEGYRNAKDFMRMLMPSHARKVQPYRDETIPLFFRYQIESQIDAMHSPVVQLRSGGYIVINQTEALVAIDVNSGRSTKERNIEETAFKTNLEASDEIARQLRLRDLAGLIVIDFIDMEDPKNNAAVERRIKEAMKNDRARIQLGRISPFGLLELSRQRLRPSLMETNFERCPHCSGTGMVRSLESTALFVLRAIEEEGIRKRSSEITVHVATRIALYILNQKRDALADIERRYSFRVFLFGDDSLIPPDLRLERIKARPALEEMAPTINPERIFAETDRVLEREVEEPELEEEEEEVEEEEETVEAGEAPAAETVEEARGDRRRRRSRRGRRRSEDRPESRGEEQPVEEVAFDAGEEAAAEAETHADTENESDIDEDAEEENGEEGSQAGDSEFDSNGQRKKRRRGKRGGRRRGRIRTENGLEVIGQGEGDSEAPAVSDIPEPATAAAPLPPVYLDDLGDVFHDLDIFAEPLPPVAAMETVTPPPTIEASPGAEALPEEPATPVAEPETPAADSAPAEVAPVEAVVPEVPFEGAAAVEAETSLEGAVEAAVEPSAEPPAKPKRAPRRRKTAAVAAAETAETPAPPEAAVATEEKPKRKRAPARRKKVATEEAATAETPSVQPEPAVETSAPAKAPIFATAPEPAPQEAAVPEPVPTETPTASDAGRTEAAENAPAAATEEASGKEAAPAGPPRRGWWNRAAN